LFIPSTCAEHGGNSQHLDHTKFSSLLSSAASTYLIPPDELDHSKTRLSRLVDDT
jgi:hypothetical protein